LRTISFSKGRLIIYIRAKRRGEGAGSIGPTVSASAEADPPALVAVTVREIIAPPRTADALAARHSQEQIAAI
jgi:hypothetical protein